MVSRILADASRTWKASITQRAFYIAHSLLRNGIAADRPYLQIIEKMPA